MLSRTLRPGSFRLGSIAALLLGGCGHTGNTYLGADASVDGAGGSFDAGGSAGSDAGGSGGTLTEGGSAGSNAGGSGGTVADGGSAGVSAAGGSAGSVASGGASGSGAAGGSAGSSAAGSGGSVQLPIIETFGEGPGADHAGVTIDTKIRGSDANTRTYDYGGGWHITPDASPITHGLLRFDLSAIPATALVLSASLDLWTAACQDCQANPGTSVALHQLFESWEEGSADSEVTATVGYCNWNNRTSLLPWASPGAEPPSSGASAVASFAPTALDTKYTIGLPTSLVQGWITSPASNHGLLLRIVDPQLTDGVAFVSSENGETADSPTKRPRLSVQYQPE